MTPGPQGLVPDGGGVVEGDQDALEAVGDLHGHRVEAHAADLLEVGELGDLLPVEPDLPTQPQAEMAGCSQLSSTRRISCWRVNADGFQRLQVEFHRVAGIGLQDDLELGVLLEAVGVLAVAPVVRADGGFHVGHIPRLGAEHAQEGGRVHRPCADLGVVGLGDEAAFALPRSPGVGG